MTDNYRKYLKYKQKYVDLKKKLDMRSGNSAETLNKINTIIEKYQEQINKINTDKPPQADLNKCNTFANLITNLNQYAVAPSASVFNRLNTLSDTTNVKEFAKEMGLNDHAESLQKLLDTYFSKNEIVKYHTKAHAFNTCYAAKVLWEQWIEPKFPPGTSDPLLTKAKKICLLAAFAHDVYHDGSTNPTYCARCTANKTGIKNSCKIWTNCGKSQPYMEEIQAIKAFEIIKDDPLFLNNDKAKEIFIEAINHTWMFNHNKEMAEIPEDLTQINSENIRDIIQYIVHAADLIGQALPLKLSEKLGRLIDHELKIANNKFDNEIAENDEPSFQKSQIGFLIFFKYIEFWFRLIRFFDKQYAQNLSHELMYNIVTNSKSYLSSECKTLYI